MLLQSHQGYLHFLPALPDVWPAGNVTGLCARGGFEVSLYWHGGVLRGATILSRLGGSCQVRYGHRMRQFATTKGRRYVFDAKLRDTAQVRGKAQPRFG